MASFQSFGGLKGIKSNAKEKMSKSSTKVVIKPILKKLSNSEKNSIDLDRGWEDQDGQYHQNHGWGGGGPSSLYDRSGSSKDVSFAFTEIATPTAGGGRRFNHSRSISGNSHVSVATSGSGSGIQGISSRAGTTFVHPFQQTPRTATPPLSYANSLASFVDARDRDYSPTITEDDDDNCDPLDNPTASRNNLHTHTSSHSSSIHHHQPTNSNSIPNSHSQLSLTSPGGNIRRPSLASQRTSSFSDIPNPHPPLRINTAPRSISTTPAQSSRLAHVSSQSDLNLYLTEESPTSTNGPASTSHRAVASPSSSVAPMSPFSRSSFEAAGFPRLRAKSDLDTATRALHVTEARRKFLAKEQAKEERYAREEIKRREREDNKRAQEIERQAVASRKERDAARRREEAAALAEAIPRNIKHGRKMSATSSGRPSTSRPSTSRIQKIVEPEKFASANYDAMETRSPPAFGYEAGGARSVAFESQKRNNSAKKKTQSAWTMFVLWLRTRLLRMGKKDE